MCYDLLRFPQNEIVKGTLQMKQKALNRAKEALNWGPDPDSLPVITRAAFDASIASGKKWVIIDGFAIDVSDFVVSGVSGREG